MEKSREIMTNESAIARMKRTEQVTMKDWNKCKDKKARACSYASGLVVMVLWKNNTKATYDSKGAATVETFIKGESYGWSVDIIWIWLTLIKGQ